MSINDIHNKRDKKLNYVKVHPPLRIIFFHQSYLYLNFIVKRGDDNITMMDDFVQYSLKISEGFMFAAPYQTT